MFSKILPPSALTLLSVLNEIDTATGTTISSKEIQISGNNANGDFYDMASTGIRVGVTIIPEPSSFALLALGSMLTVGRRRRLNP